MKDKTARRSERRRIPAFLTAPHRGMELVKSELRTPTIPVVERNKTLGLLPRLTAELGFAMAGRDVQVELLPGSPAIVAFTAGGKLVSLMVLPMDVDQARQTLRLPSISTRDIAADALFEEQRENLRPDELLLQAQSNAWEL